MIKRKAELVKLAQAEGLANVTVVETKGNHYRVEGQHQGKTIKVIAAFSASDHRNLMNYRGNIRRSMRAVESPIAMRA
jgi:hypothetical protein